MRFIRKKSKAFTYIGETRTGCFTDSQNRISLGTEKKYTSQRHILVQNVFIVEPCMLIVLSPLFVQLMHTDYYKIDKQLKSFKIIITASTCFGLHKSSSGSSQHLLR